MSNFGFVYELLDATSRKRILTEAILGTQMGPVLEQIAKTVHERGGSEKTKLRMVKAQINEDTVITDPRKMESLTTLVTMATEHYQQKSGTLVVETVIDQQPSLDENLAKVLTNPKKAKKLITGLVEAAITHKGYSVHFEDGYVKVKHPKHGTVAAGMWDDNKKQIKDIGFPDERHRKSNTIRQPAMAALAKWQNRQQATHELTSGKIWDKTAPKKVNELELPNLDIGDTLLVGKWKNRKATIKGFDTDENGQPIAKTNKGDQKIFKPRVAKLMPGHEDGKAVTEKEELYHLHAPGKSEHGKMTVMHTGDARIANKSAEKDGAPFKWVKHSEWLDKELRKK